MFLRTELSPNLVEISERLARLGVSGDGEDAGEGLATYRYIPHQVAFVITGMRGAIEGRPFQMDRTFKITKVKVTDDGDMVCFANPIKGDIDELLAAIKSAKAKPTTAP